MQATCATSTNALQHAKMYIENGNAFAILNGYEELSLAPGGNDFFTSLGAKSGTNSCRPFDEGRDGTVFKDGYVTVIVEDLEHAKQRGAEIYGTIDDVAVYNDASNPISPDPKGTGARLAYSQLFDDKDIKIDYISAHATGTVIGDPVEIDILKDYFPDVPVASLKGHIGHGMGASGLLETVYCVEMMKNNTLIHTHGLDNPIASDLNILTKPLETEVNAILKNNFGFGGRASAFVLQKY
jgi:3-oxoacyl-[acyl-carrier-protein] synthase II